MVKVQTQSTVRPEEWDTSSSPTTVYHNYDIEEVPATEDSPVLYNYTQDQYTQDEYWTYLAQKNRADILYIAMMVDIDLDA